MSVATEKIPIEAGSRLDIVDRGDGVVEVWLAHDTASMIGLGRTRELALEAARTTLQQALNVVDVAIVKGRR